MNEETTQADLLELAKKHQSNIAIRVLVSEISRLKLRATSEAKAIESQAKQIVTMLELPDRRISSYGSSLVSSSSEVIGCISLIAQNFDILAILLQESGEQINY